MSEGRERRVSEGRDCDPLDGLEQLYRALEQANVTALGDPKPCSKQELRRCFTQRVRDPLLNDRLHRVRALRSTLKVPLISNNGLYQKADLKYLNDELLSGSSRPKSLSWQ